MRTASCVKTFASFTFLIAIASAASGCAMGGLGQVAFQEACSPQDASCNRKGFDKPLAVGGVVRPEISTHLRGSGAPAMHYQAADPTVLRTEDGRVEGVAPGMSAVLAMTDDGTVLDMFHVWVKEPSGIDLLAIHDGDKRSTMTGTLELFTGEIVRLETAVHGEGQVLSGDIPQEWKLDKPIGLLLEDGRTAGRRLVATDPGEATLTIHAGKAYTSLKIVVRKPVGRSDARLSEVSR